ncbi:MAG: flagellar biosynthetic protein FliQ [Dethiobacter sp.]|jgi:flagellar biosynthetic protein FliQ|nr:MAG: flagellar biosynthetic protein FliQ [Dethiobacter sp.]
MSEEFVLSLARDTVNIMLLTAAPILLISLLVGLSVSIFQATTQIQEPTMTFVPKIVAVFLTILIFGSWMLNLLITFSIGMFNNMSVIIR